MLFRPSGFEETMMSIAEFRQGEDVPAWGQSHAGEYGNRFLRCLIAIGAFGDTVGFRVASQE
jgi:hypothetical protein